MSRVSCELVIFARSSQGNLIGATRHSHVIWEQAVGVIAPLGRFANLNRREELEESKEEESEIENTEADKDEKNLLLNGAWLLPRGHG